MHLTRCEAFLAVLVTILTITGTIQQAANTAYADNSASATHVGVCTASYHSERFTVELAVPDKRFTDDDRRSLETMMIDRWLLPEVAGKYFHEMYDYPNPPKSVHRSDLDKDSLACHWTVPN